MSVKNGTPSLKLDLTNELASQEMAKKLASCLTNPLVMTFSGEIGTGKTTFIRAMLHSLGIQSVIKSPTFSLVESYQQGTLSIHHFDLYRLQHEDELDYLGFRDFFTPESICCIEWAEHAGKALLATDICFKLSIKGAGREMQIDALSNAGKKILICLMDLL